MIAYNGIMFLNTVESNSSSGMVIGIDMTGGNLEKGIEGTLITFEIESQTSDITFSISNNKSYKLSFIEPKSPTLIPLKTISFGVISIPSHKWIKTLAL